MAYFIKKTQVRTVEFVARNYKALIFPPMLLSALAAYLYIKDIKKEAVEPIRATVAAVETAESGVQEPTIASGVVRQKETCSKILNGFFPAKVVQDILKASEKVYPLKNIQKGRRYSVGYELCEEKGKLFRSFEYEIDQSKKLTVEQTDAGIVARVAPITYDYQLSYVRGLINTSLFEAILTEGEGVSLVSSLVSIFGAEIDFIKDLRVGDTFGILVEKRFRDGEFKGYGRVLAAKIINKGKTYEAYRFPCDKGYEQYYTSKGESLKRMFLKAPLEFTRISSGFSLSRKHPIHADRRPHLGVDYAAPVGTPVKAVADGAVRSVGWQGGFGNVVVVKHKNGFETMYGHLSRFSCDAKVGKSIKQGQVIGFVGATGVATGPHLDFRVKHRGRYVNPVKMLNPRVGSIAESRLEDYRSLVLELKAYMNGTQSCGNYKPEKFL